MIFRRIGVIGVMVGIHEHGELVLFRPRRIKDYVAMLEIDGIVAIAIVERNMRRQQADLLEIDGRLNRDGKLPEERVVQVNFNEMLFVVTEIAQHEPEEPLRRIGALGCIRAVIFKHHGLFLFLMNKLQLKRNGGRTCDLVTTAGLRCLVWFGWCSRSCRSCGSGWRCRCWWLGRLRGLRGLRGLRWICRPADAARNGGRSPAGPGVTLDMNRAVWIVRSATRRAPAIGGVSVRIARETWTHQPGLRVISDDPQRHLQTAIGKIKIMLHVRGVLKSFPA